MRNLLRLALLSAALLTLALTSTSALADRPTKPTKADKLAQKALEKLEKAKEKGASRDEDDDEDDGRGKSDGKGNGDAASERKGENAAVQPFGGVPAAIVNPGEPAHPENTQFAETIGAQTLGGAILVKVPGTDTFTRLAADAPLPIGSTVDATDGLVEISSEAGPGGAEQNAVVTGGVFRINQDAGSGGLTDLALKGGDFSDCRKVTARSAGKGSGDVARGIWAAGKGRFRTKGRHSAATVRGTRWSVVDRCHSTTVKVFEGIVDVNDFGLGRTIPVRAGERHVAREPRS